MWCDWSPHRGLPPPPPPNHQQITVGVRLRPPTRAEVDTGAPPAFLAEPKAVLDVEKQAPYPFDFVWGSTADNAVIYKDMGRSIIESITKGYNGWVSPCVCPCECTALCVYAYVCTPVHVHKLGSMCVCALASVFHMGVFVTAWAMWAS